MKNEYTETPVAIAPAVSTGIASPEHHAGLIREHIKKGDRDIQKGEDHYRSAGLLLAQYKAVAKSQSVTWPVFLDRYCEIKVRRANDLIAIGDGRKTLAEIRGEIRERVERHRALRNARSEEDATAEAALRSSPSRQRAWSAHAAYLKALAEMDDDERKEVIALIPRADDAKGTKERLQRANDIIDGLKSTLSIRDSYLIISSKRADEEVGKRMFAEADKDKLQRENEELREELRKQEGIATEQQSSSTKPDLLAVALAAYDALSPEEKARFHKDRPAPVKAKPITFATATSVVPHVAMPLPRVAVATAVPDFVPAHIARDWEKRA